MEFPNAFTAGLQPGGLTTDLEVQVFVCYLLKHIGIPATFDQLSEIIQTDGMVNYRRQPAEAGRSAQRHPQRQRGGGLYPDPEGQADCGLL